MLNAKKNSSKKSERKEVLKKIARNSTASTKVTIYNAFMTLVFGLAMFIASIAAIETAYIASGFMIGRSSTGNFTEPSDLMVNIVVIAISIIMVCGLVLFFTFKLENWLIKNLCKRLWHVNKETGEIIKNNKTNDVSMNAKTETKIEMINTRSKKNNKMKNKNNTEIEENINDSNNSN